eukprot:g1867.t1
MQGPGLPLISTAVSLARNAVARCMDSKKAAEAAFHARRELGTQPSITEVGTSFTTLAALNVGYLLVTWLLYRFMQRREGDFKAQLKPVIFVYNALCVALAGYVVWGIAQHKLTGEGRDEPFACNDGARTDPTGKQLAFVFWVFYAQKFFEFADTWFFILRRSFRQVTFLHVFHHSSITLVVGSILRYDFSGDMYLPILLNAVVHVLMYSHYLVTALGIRSWWRQYLTTLQLAQFCLIASQSIIAWRAGPACGAPDFAKVILVAYMLSMLLLFGRFFMRRYVLKKSDTQFCGVIKHVDVMHAPKTLNGVAALDGEGKARVRVNVPRSAAAAEGQFAYQLTAVGAPMPQLHVAAALNWAVPHAPTADFAIAGGKPRAAVCWQLIRLPSVGTGADAGEAKAKAKSL